jgi:hypothetical protein
VIPALRKLQAFCIARPCLKTTKGERDREREVQGREGKRNKK